MSNTLDYMTPEQLNAYAIRLSGADVDAMVAGYLDCQLWAGLDYDHAVDGEPVNYDENYDVTDVDTDYIEGLREEFAALVTAHPLAVRMYLNTWGRYENARREYDRNELFGHDFYLTREGHGAGFWDRGLGDLGDYLTKIAEDAGSADDLSDNGNGVLVV